MATPPKSEGEMPDIGEIAGLSRAEYDAKDFRVQSVLAIGPFQALEYVDVF